MKLNYHKARRLIHDGFSKKEWDWNVPGDLCEISKKFPSSVFVSMGRWINNNLQYFILVFNGHALEFDKVQLEFFTSAFKTNEKTPALIGDEK